MRGRRIAFAAIAWLLAAQSTGCQHAPDRKALASQLNQTVADLGEQFTQWTEERATEIGRLPEENRVKAAAELEALIIRWQALLATIGPLLEAYEAGDTSKVRRLETWVGKATSFIGNLP